MSLASRLASIVQEVRDMELVHGDDGHRITSLERQIRELQRDNARIAGLETDIVNLRAENERLRASLEKEKRKKTVPADPTILPERDFPSEPNPQMSYETYVGLYPGDNYSLRTYFRYFRHGATDRIKPVSVIGDSVIKYAVTLSGLGRYQNSIVSNENLVHRFSTQYPVGSLASPRYGDCIESLIAWCLRPGHEAQLRTLLEGVFAAHFAAVDFGMVTDAVILEYRESLLVNRLYRMTHTTSSTSGGSSSFLSYSLFGR